MVDREGLEDSTDTQSRTSLPKARRWNLDDTNTIIFRKKQYKNSFVLTKTSSNTTLPDVHSHIAICLVFLQHCLHQMENSVGIMNLIQRTPWIRVGHWIDIYDVKTRLTHGRHGIGAEQKNSLEKKMIEHPAWLIKKN